jgi:hypothetical protein
MMSTLLAAPSVTLAAFAKPMTSRLSSHNRKPSRIDCQEARLKESLASLQETSG